MTTPTELNRPRQARARRGRFVFLPFALVTLAAIPCVIIGCDKPAATAASGPTHTVRGRVVSLPVANDPSSSFSVFHETIAEWRRPDGSKGMNAMVMPFPLGEGASLEGIAAGDVVELVVRQQPENAVPYVATKVTKLPADTALTLPERKSK